MNKKILIILATLLILKTPKQFKISAMEKNTLETLEKVNKNSYFLNKYQTLKENQLNFKFSKNEYFNEIFENLLLETFSNTLFEDLRKYLIYYSLYFKTANKNYKYFEIIYELKGFEKNIIQNFKKNISFYMEKINEIIKKENLQVNVFYYEILLNQIYDYYFSTLINYVICEVVHNNKNYKELIDLLKKHSDYLFKDIKNFILIKVNIKVNKEENLTTKHFNSLLDYSNHNPGILPLGFLSAHKLKVEFHEIYGLLTERLEQILKYSN